MPTCLPENLPERLVSHSVLYYDVSQIAMADSSPSWTDVPCTVDFAPAAAKAPIDPAMKYWKTLFEVSPLLLLYLSKLGILFTSTLANGLSKGALASALLRCWTATADALRAGNLCRVHTRSAVQVEAGIGAMMSRRMSVRREMEL